MAPGAGALLVVPGWAGVSGGACRPQTLQGAEVPPGPWLPPPLGAKRGGDRGELGSPWCELRSVWSSQW